MKYYITMILFLTSVICAQRSSNMSLTKHLDEHSGYFSALWGYQAPNGREYAIMGFYNGTSFIDVSDTTNVHEVCTLYGIASGWREEKVYSHYAYIVSEAPGSGLQIVDLSYLPDSVHLVNTFLFPGFSRAHTISQSGTCLYVNGGDYGNGGTFILDLSIDPVNPVKRGQWEDAYVHDCRIINDTIWTCDPLSGNITVVNGLIKDNLRTINYWYNTPYPVPHNCALTVDNKYCLVCDENFSQLGKLKIWDVENLNNVTFVTSWQVQGTSQSIHNVEIYGNMALIAYYGEGVRALDITNVSMPREFAWYKTSRCWAVYMFNSGKIIASDIDSGFYSLRLDNPIGIQSLSKRLYSFGLYDNFPNPFNPTTNIKFDLAQSGFVKLTVFDALGREVATLVNKEMIAGSYYAEWDASDYSSGIYFYKISIQPVERSERPDSYVETKKMVLIK